jgi:hypothetical protein
VDWLALALLVASVQSVQVDGELGCPAPDEVTARLEQLLSAETPGPVHRARIERDGGAVRITLLRADGSLLAERLLDGGHPCSELAAAAAAIIASWQTERAPEVITGLPARGKPAVATDRVAAVSAGESPALFDVALGAGGSLAGGAVAPAVLLSGSLGQAAGGLGARLTALAGGQREQPLGRGKLVWSRAALALGPQIRWLAGRTCLEAHAGAAAALTRLAGADFPTNRRHQDVELGAAGGLRVVWAQPGWAPWLEVVATAWPRPPAGFEETAGTAGHPARTEAFVVLGMRLQP